MGILIVDDNPVTATALEGSLQNLGYNTFTARTGKEALDLLNREGDVSLIVTDIRMPDMDGFELMKTLSESSLWCEIPVVAVSAQADRESVLQAKALGCQHFIVKPVDTKKLIAVVQELLGGASGEKVPVLVEQSQMIKKLSLTAKSYRKILESFWKQANMAAVRMENMPSGPMNADFIKDLLELIEGAALVGAERLRRKLERLRMLRDTRPADIDASHTADMLQELRSLRRALLIALRSEMRDAEP